LKDSKKLTSLFETLILYLLGILALAFGKGGSEAGIVLGSVVGRIG
jgi:hypothetical protein